MVQRALPVVSKCIEMSWEFSLESWKNVVESKGIGSCMNPSRVCSKQAQSLSWPETVLLIPDCNLWTTFLHVSIKIINVEFESAAISL